MLQNKKNKNVSHELYGEINLLKNVIKKNDEEKETYKLALEKWERDFTKFKALNYHDSQLSK